ncbi:hypothetical protein L3Q82_004840 [Scortum barcoo]|uniref:Uncharacterized protein n=1 Tax=Scortum barcoo TaxID=214431 RepID=A0ACB8VDI2_9TELE|nr:hypothetical protein L3Q82_004840 [Scortum barcoo]
MSISKTKKLIVDFRKRQREEHVPLPPTGLRWRQAEEAQHGLQDPLQASTGASLFTFTGDVTYLTSSTFVHRPGNDYKHREKVFWQQFLVPLCEKEQSSGEQLPPFALYFIIYFTYMDQSIETRREAVIRSLILYLAILSLSLCSPYAKDSAALTNTSNLVSLIGLQLQPSIVSIYKTATKEDGSPPGFILFSHTEVYLIRLVFALLVIYCTFTWFTQMEVVGKGYKVVCLDMASLQTQRKEGSQVFGADQQIKAGPVRRLQAGEEDGCLCPGVCSHQEDSAGTTRLRGSCTVSLTCSWSAPWAAFVFGIAGSITQPAAALQGRKKTTENNDALMFYSHLIYRKQLFSAFYCRK